VSSNIPPLPLPPLNDQPLLQKWGETLVEYIKWSVRSHQQLVKNIESRDEIYIKKFDDLKELIQKLANDTTASLQSEREARLALEAKSGWRATLVSVIAGAIPTTVAIVWYVVTH